MKKFIILFASLFVILTPAVSYASCEDAGDCDNYINGSGQMFGDYEDCMAAPDTEIFGGGCEGVGGGDYGDWDNDDPGSDGDGTFVCCTSEDTYPDGYSSCTRECSGACVPYHEDISGACQNYDGEDGYSDGCGQFTSESECEAATQIVDGDYYVICSWYNDVCAIEQTNGCIMNGRTIDCDYLTKFIAGVNSGKITLETSDGGQYHASYMNVCESGDTDCFNHMTNNWCAYLYAATSSYVSDDEINIIDARFWANQNLGTTCRVPVAAVLDKIENVCSYGDLVAGQWYEGADCSSAIDDTWGFCYSLNEMEDYECEEFISSHCDAIFAALDSEYASNGGDEDAARSAVSQYLSKCGTGGGTGSGALTCGELEKFMDATSGDYELEYYLCNSEDYGANSFDGMCDEDTDCLDKLHANYEKYQSLLCGNISCGYDEDWGQETCWYNKSAVFQDLYSQYGIMCEEHLGSKICDIAFNAYYSCSGSGDCDWNMPEDMVDDVCGYDTGEGSFCEQYFMQNATDWQDAWYKSEYDTPIDYTDELGLNCTMPAFVPNCALLKAAWYIGENSGEFNGNLPEDMRNYVERYYSSAPENWLKQIKMYSNKYEQALSESGYDFDKAARKLGLDCSAICRISWKEYFFDQGGGSACNYDSYDVLIYEGMISEADRDRILAHCDSYDQLFDQYPASYPEGIYEIGDQACYDDNKLDVSDLKSGHDCVYFQGWWDAVQNGGRSDDEIEYICEDIVGDSSGDEYLRCVYYFENSADFGHNDYENRAEYYTYLISDGYVNMDDLYNELGITCSDSCGEGEYLKRGQCFDCKLPTSKHTEFFAGYEAGTKNCAHTYNTIVDKGLKIHDLKCELADDMTNWKCTVNALECGGGYYGPEMSSMNLRAVNTESHDLTVKGFAPDGRLYVNDWGREYCDKSDPEYEDECWAAVDFVYVSDPLSECGDPDYDGTDGYSFHPCVLPISAPLIDRLRCDTPIPKGYYGSTSYMQASFDFAPKWQCSKGYYQDETGQTWCKSCPQYNIKNTNGTTVFGTTSSTASTSASACYIDSVNYFRGKNGKYHFTPQCNYD